MGDGGLIIIYFGQSRPHARDVLDEKDYSGPATSVYLRSIGDGEKMEWRTDGTTRTTRKRRHIAFLLCAERQDLE